jgi:hypothetical protein
MEFSSGGLVERRQPLLEVGFGCDRYEDLDAGAFDDMRSMALALGIVGEQNIAGAQYAPRAVAAAVLNLSAQQDDELAPWGWAETHAQGSPLGVPQRDAQGRQRWGRGAED